MSKFMRKVKVLERYIVHKGLLQGLQGVCESWPQHKCRCMTMISFSRNRGLNQSPLQTNKRRTGLSAYLPQSASWQGHNRER